MLAQLCGPAPPVEPDHEGFFYFERDWYYYLICAAITVA
jgi:hypothetical protein